MIERLAEIRASLGVPAYAPGVDPAAIGPTKNALRLKSRRARVVDEGFCSRCATAPVEPERRARGLRTCASCNAYRLGKFAADRAAGKCSRCSSRLSKQARAEGAKWCKPCRKKRAANRPSRAKNPELATIGR